MTEYEPVFFYGIPEVREAFKSFLEAMRFILTECEPISSHGEFICPNFELQGGSVSAEIVQTNIILVVE